MIKSLLGLNWLTLLQDDYNKLKCNLGCIKVICNDVTINLWNAIKMIKQQKGAFQFVILYFAGVVDMERKLRYFKSFGEFSKDDLKNSNYNNYLIFGIIAIQAFNKQAQTNQISKNDLKFLKLKLELQQLLNIWDLIYLIINRHIINKHIPIKAAEIALNISKICFVHFKFRIKDIYRIIIPAHVDIKIDNIKK